MVAISEDRYIHNSYGNFFLDQVLRQSTNEHYSMIFETVTLSTKWR